MNPTLEHYTAQAEVAELVSALSEARAQIEYLHGKFHATGSGNAVLARIGAILFRYAKQKEEA